MTKNHEEYNERQGENDLLDMDSMVQYFMYPQENMTTTDETFKSNILQFKLSDQYKLADYNLFKSKYFDFDSDTMDNYQRVKLKPKQKQTLFKFEKIVDSNIQIKMVPFLSYQKDIMPLGTIKDSDVCIFNNFMLQALYFKEDLIGLFEEICVTTSGVTSPKTIDRMTLSVDSQIQLWRCSDHFKSNNGSVTMHYK